MEKKGKPLVALGIVVLFLLMVGVKGCGSWRTVPGGQSSDSQVQDCFKGKRSGETIRILSGSENQELSEVLAQCAENTGVNIEMTYKGSVDIMHELQNGAGSYDAVWPASGIWMSIGDTQHLIKYDASISTTPVVFGIRRSLAEQLGFVGKEVSVNDILQAVESGELSFCMTSATQSNSGASAYIGYLYAMLGKSEGMTEADLDSPELKDKMQSLLGGVNRSSGSSDWLKEMFLTGDFDAMVNYECLIIDANKKLIAQGKEPLYVIYPYDGLAIADSPLGYVDHGKDKKQEAFLKIQEYLLSEEAQSAIQKTGRRTGLEGVSAENQDIFNPDWGIDTQRVLSPFSMPSEAVLMKALNLYQTSFRKPSLSVYCLDFSGSMSGTGNEQLVDAMSQILLQDKAAENLLQAQEGEINIIITFDDRVQNVYRCDSGNAGELEQLYEKVAAEKVGGGTDMYAAALEALYQIEGVDNLEQYSPAIIMMTDGASSEYTQTDFETEYQSLGQDIPVFSIMFGEAESQQLEWMAALSNARVFDGTKDLVSAFRSVKGYN